MGPIKDMYTEIKNIKTGKTKFFRIQQYAIGCYVIEDDNPALQYGLDTTEKNFHNSLKMGLDKNWKWVKTL